MHLCRCSSLLCLSIYLYIYIRALTDMERNWKIFLIIKQFELKNSFYNSFGLTPFQALYYKLTNVPKRFSTFLPKDYTPFLEITQKLLSFPIPSLLDLNYYVIFNPHTSLFGYTIRLCLQIKTCVPVYSEL